MFTLTIDTDGAAFEHGCGEPLRILRNVSERLDAGRREGSVMDSNGNTCGNFTYEPPEWAEEEGDRDN